MHFRVKFLCQAGIEVRSTCIAFAISGYKVGLELLAGLS